MASDYHRQYQYTRQDGSQFRLGHQVDEYAQERVQITPDANLAPEVHKAIVTDGLQTSLENFTHDAFVAELEAIARGSGTKSFRNSISTFMSQHNRAGVGVVYPNLAHVGMTFITRPHLPMVSANLRRDPVMQLFDTLNPNHLAFAIRMLLDPVQAKRNPQVWECPYINSRNPFNIPLCNALLSISGLPDPVMETFSTTDGFWGENQTIARGTDWLNGTYNLNLLFRDIVYSPILYMLYAWLRMMDHLIRGTMVAYVADRDFHRIPYTVSIYRFRLDPGREYITENCRLVGCFPTSVPLGDLFNYHEGETFNNAGYRLSIPFIANGVAYMDPYNYVEFNTLVEQYTGNTSTEILSWPALPPYAMYNYEGVPYIEFTNGGPKLTFRDPTAARS